MLTSSRNYAVSDLELWLLKLNGVLYTSQTLQNIFIGPTQAYFTPQVAVFVTDRCLKSNFASNAEAWPYLQSANGLMPYI